MIANALIIWILLSNNNINNITCYFQLYNDAHRFSRFICLPAGESPELLRKLAQKENELRCSNEALERLQE